jgi:ABC-type transport system substrate-binding protein
MDHSSRPAGLPLSRLLAALLLPLLAFSLVWLTASLAAQAPKKEEEEEPPMKAKAPKGKGEEEEEKTPMKAKARPKVEEEEEATPKPKRKVARPEDVEPAKTPTATKVDIGDAPDLVSAARQAKNPAVREFLDSIAEPHDIVVNPRIVKRVAPVDKYLGNPPRFTGTIELRPFADDEWVEDKKSWTVTSSYLTGISYYEQIALKRVDEFLQLPLDRGDPSKKNYVSRHEMLRIAETALAAVLRFHESAHEQGKREGEGFDPLEAALRTRLFKARLDQLNLLGDANDWDGALALAGRLADAYPKADDQKGIATALSQIISRAAQSGSYSDPQLLEMQKRLRQLEERFPTIGAALPINEKLKQQAENLFARAREILEKDPNRRREALDLLRRAEDVFPRLPGLHDYRLKLDNALAVLRVGVRDLPVNLSPNLACTDSEKQAVELMFESVVKVTYDPDMGQSYAPGLAEGRPLLIPLGRQFHIDPNAYWSNQKPVTALDVRHTVRLLKSPKWSGYSHTWEEFLNDPQVGQDPSQVRLTLTQGMLDPLALMTFKVLPAEPWPDHTLTPNDETRFGQRPVGSGPYELGQPGTAPGGRPYVSFVASSGYGGRAGKVDLPRIREVQFVQSPDPVADLRAGSLDLVVDLPSDKVAAAQSPGAKVPVVVLPPLPNRRIYFLAVNYRRAALQNADLRKAIAHAIDRDKVLDDVFRAGLGKSVHRPLDGPYPPGSWACGPAQRYSVDVAKSHIEKAKEAGLNGVKLSLKYPNDDPRVKTAMEAVKEQVQKEVGVDLDLQALPPRQLREDVEGAHDYELAYYHYDYPTDAFWLWPLFDPRATDTRGSNYLGYRNDAALEKQFGEVLARRDFPQVQKATHILHELVFDRMPFIPLWQLDTHVAMSRDLKTVPFNPLLVFTDIEQWRLEKK